MKVKLLADCYGPTLVGKAGDVVEVDAADFGAGLAERADAAPKRPAKKAAKKAKAKR